MTRPTTAIVLAAGYGVRMRPLTDDRPKPLVELAGKPLVDHVLDRLGAAGVAKVIVNVHFMADKLEAHLAGRKQPQIVISDERAELLSTGGGAAKALKLADSECVFIHNSDSVWVEGITPALEAMIERWDEDAMDTLLLLAPIQGSIGYDGRGDFSMDADGRLARRRENEVVPFVFAGVSIAHPRLFKDAPGGAFSMNVLWDKAMEAGRMYGIRHNGVWMHVGTPGALAEAEALLKTSDG